MTWALLSVRWKLQFAGMNSRHSMNIGGNNRPCDIPSLKTDESSLRSSFPSVQFVPRCSQVFDSSNMVHWFSSGCKSDNAAVKPDSDLSLHARCGCTSAAWFKLSFAMSASLSCSTSTSIQLQSMSPQLHTDCGQSCFSF